jgi:hypothetical protein
MKECPPDQTQIAHEIFDYLSEQPNAEDTLEGIMRHRLPESPTGQQTTVVKEVVADLVTQGLLERVKKEDRTVYRVRSRE